MDGAAAAAGERRLGAGRFGRISKMGDRYLRRLLVLGSRAQGAPKPHPNRAQATQSAIYCAISMAYAKRAQMGNSEWFGQALNYE